MWDVTTEATTGGRVSILVKRSDHAHWFAADALKANEIHSLGGIENVTNTLHMAMCCAGLSADAIVIMSKTLAFLRDVSLTTMGADNRPQSRIG